MEVTGKLILRQRISDGIDNWEEATIELPSVDVSKIKEGDKVLEEIKVPAVHVPYWLIDRKIVAHFPQPKQEQKQDVKVPKELEEVIEAMKRVQKYCEDIMNGYITRL